MRGPYEVGCSMRGPYEVGCSMVGMQINIMYI